MRWAKYLLVLNVVITVWLAASLLLSPITIDVTHVGDTLLLGHLGWRGVHGLRPVLDYAHFYGGMTATFVTFAFKLFGVAYKSVDYAFVMMFIVAAVVFLALSWKRLPREAAALLVALGAALVLSMMPIEVASPLIVAHSYVYNHVAIFLMMSLLVFGLASTGSRRLENMSAVVAGLSTYGLILLKTTFGVMLPGLVLAAAIQGRWRSALLVSAGAVFGMLVMDPGMTRALGSLSFLLDSAAAARAGGVGGRLAVAGTIILSQLPQLGVVLVIGGLHVWSHGRASLNMILAAFVLALAYLAAALTMDGRATLKLIPFIVTFALIVPPFTSVPAQRRVLRGAVRVFPFGLAYAFILPALASSTYAAVQSFRYADMPFTEDGPMTGYFVLGAATQSAAFEGATPEARRTLALAETLARLRAEEEPLDAGDAFMIQLDGMDLLREIPDVASYGIVPNGVGFDFTMPLLSRPVPGYPVWPTPGLPGLEPAGELGPDIDLVMIFHDFPRAGALNDELKLLVADDFTACRTSEIWVVYARQTIAGEICDGDLMFEDG